MRSTEKNFHNFIKIIHTICLLNKDCSTCNLINIKYIVIKL